MTATTSPSAADRERRPAGPDVLALPPPTTPRMLLVAAVLVVTALFVGTALHNTLLGPAWDAAIRACLPPGTLVAENVEQLRCQAPAERRRALVAVGAVLAALLLAAGVVLTAPAVVRRRARLKVPGPAYRGAADRLAALAVTAGVRPPGLLIVPGAVTEAFCVGRPGAYRVAVPRKLALRGVPVTAALFDAVVAHEIAHLRHRDVALSWLARSLAYVVGGMLALPVVIALVVGEPSLAAEVAARAALLLGVTVLAVRSLMRSREHDADLRAARTHGAGSVLDAELARHPDPVSPVRAAVAWHPGPRTRRAVLADPLRAVRTGVIDGVVLGFLVGAGLPLVQGVVSAALLGERAAATIPPLVAALTVGALAGTVTGTELWRDALAARGRRRGATGRLTLGVLVGAVLGQSIGLGDVALGVRPEIVVAVVLAGTTVLVGGLGELWTSGVGRTRGPRSVLVPAVVSGTVLTGAGLWAAPQVQAQLDGGGWPLLSSWLVTPGAGTALGFVAVLAALAGGWAVRPGRDGAAPVWWGAAPSAVLRGGGGVLAIGVVAGLSGGVAGLALVPSLVPVSLTGAGAAQVQDAIVLGGAVLAALVVLALGVVRGAAGAAEGLVAGPVAAATSTAMTILPLGPPAGTAAVAGAAVSAGFLLSVVAAPVSAAGPVDPRPGAGPVAVLLAAALVAGAVVPGAVAVRGTVAPGLPAVDLRELGPPVPRDLYFDVVARPLFDSRVRTVNAFGALQAAQPSDAEAVARIRSDILPVLRRMRDSARAVRLDDPVLIDIHRHVIAGAEAQTGGFEAVIRALETGDRAELATGNALITRGNDEFELWAGGVLTL